MQAQILVRVLNALTKSPQFSYTKARAAARSEPNVDWPRTKVRNEGFNADVDGCESFVMRDGSICQWKPAHIRTSLWPNEGRRSHVACMRVRNIPRNTVPVRPAERFLEVTA